MIKNLSQFKKAIASGKAFEVVKHYVHPEYAGQVRVPNVIQTNGFYSAVLMPDGTKNSDWNYGKGIWYPFEKASDYDFSGDIISCMSHGRKIFDIRFIDA